MIGLFVFEGRDLGDASVDVESSIDLTFGTDAHVLQWVNAKDSSCSATSRSKCPLVQ